MVKAWPTNRHVFQGTENVKLITVNRQGHKLSDRHGLTVEGVLDGLEQLHQSANCQDTSTGHGLAHVPVQAEKGAHVVADAESNQHSLRGDKEEGLKHTTLPTIPSLSKTFLALRIILSQIEDVEHNTAASLRPLFYLIQIVLI